MSMPWGLVGPAFSYPTPYAGENRLLLGRGGVLLLLALGLWMLASFSPDPASDAATAWSGADREPGSPWPVSLAAALFATLGVINIVRAVSQRRLLLEPGQPAPLTGVLLREASGASPGAAWLQRAMVNGAPEPLPVEGPWRRVLLRLAPELGHWPCALHQHLARRLFHLLLCAAMLVLLVPVWLFTGGVAAAVAALGLGALVVGVIGASAILPRRPVGGPGMLLLWLLLGLGVAVAAVFLTPMLPGQDALRGLLPLALPTALASLLGGLVLVEGLALLAGRAQLGPVAAGWIDSHQGELDPEAGLRGFATELDLELHRRWAEGVPSRRHAWQMPAIDGTGSRGSFRGVVLEESHPLLPAAEREHRWSWPRPGSSAMWLAGLGLLCLMWTLAGGGFWIWQGWTYLHDASVYWTKGGVGLALVVAAGHALRASHLLRSRFEVESTVTWLELHGEWLRPVPGTAATVRRHRAHVSVAQARSVFYAAAEHRLGSRTLRSLTGDDASAGRWLQTLQQLAQTLAHSPAAADDARPPRPQAPVQAQDQAQEQASARAPRQARGQAPVQAPGQAPRQLPVQAAGQPAGGAAPAAPLAPAPAPARAPAPAPAPAPAVRSAIRHCEVCQATLPALARFCPSCGSAVPRA